MAFWLPVGIQNRIKSGLISSLLASCLCAAPPADKPKPGAVAGAKKTNRKITVDELRDMSCIATFTDTEELLLERISNSPRKTRDALVRMMKRRRELNLAATDRLSGSQDPSTMMAFARAYEAYQSFGIQIPKMEALKVD
ncbi:MAG: hypothetical protein IPN59_11715 [Holophaga sp.]|nr:hypothetical protein [Holophaga sp.]